MNMLKTSSFALYALLCLTLVASAQDKKDIRATLDPKRGFVKVRIGLEDFTPANGLKPLSSDSTTLVRLNEIVHADLDFATFYEVVGVDSFYMKHMELKVMNLLAWSQLGADYVVKGDAIFSRDSVDFSYKMFVAKSGMEFAHGKFKSLSQNWRRLGHTIANDIIYYLSGEKGVFDTRICFVSSRSGNKELFVCDYDGANVYQLTNNKSINISPAFTPESRQIIFTSFMKGYPYLYQYDMISGAVEPISSYPGINSAAEISPDGKELSCSLSRDGNPEIYLLERSGKIKRRLTISPSSIETSPSWSPTGNEMAFSSDRTGSPQIYIMDRDGLNVRRITYIGNYNESPDWSPKGDKLVYVSRVDGRFNICTIDITGDNYRVLTELGNNEDPHWAPDGNHIVFSSNRGGTYEVYVMDMYGNEEKRLTTGGGNSNPAWSGYSR